MAILGARAIGFSSFPSSSSYLSWSSRATSSSFTYTISMQMVSKSIISRGCVTCSAVQESSSPTATAETMAITPAEAKTSAAAETKAVAAAQDDLSEIELSFQDNKLEGSFLKKGCPYSFWVFFPNGVLTGPKGFSLSSYGSGASTVEPFLIDERKITAKHVVFWVEKRLAAQGVIPVWKE
ncbi:hypothetical protein CRYUN_Cryun01aG0135100 [Craigia yunnanensis]